MTMWKMTAEGFASGPQTVLTLSGGRTVILQPFWTDDEGVSVTVDGVDDPLPRQDVERVAVAMIQMAAAPAPEEAAAC